MGEAKRLELTLLGKTLTVRTEASREYLQSLARYPRMRSRRCAARACGTRPPR